MTWPHGDPNAVARHVLSGAAYHRAAATTAAAPERSLLQIAWDWFVHSVLAPIFEPVVRAFAASRNVGTALGVVLVIVALLGLGFVVVRLALAFGRGARRTALESSALSGGATFAATDWRAVAREAAACGEYARAIAALWAAALVLLDERALVTLDPARTPGEYRRSVRRVRSAAAAPFDTLGERFVYATYAATASSARDFEIAEGAFTAFEPAATAA